MIMGSQVSAYNEASHLQNKSQEQLPLKPNYSV